MKVVHVNTTDTIGGAARATFRICDALNEQGVDSKLLVQSKSSDSFQVESIETSNFQKGLTKIRQIYYTMPLRKYKQRDRVPFSVANIGVDITQSQSIQEADVIHLQWVNKGFLSIDNIKKLKLLQKPIIWTLHDMWAFTGGCHYSSGCDRYKEQCGACPILKSSNKNDITNKIWAKKLKAFDGMDLTIVTCSNWLADCAKESSLFKNFRIEVIPNPIDIDIFKPIEKKNAREILNVSSGKFLLLFGAMDATSDERKGFKYLVECLTALHEKYPETSEKIELLVFGSSYAKDINDLPFSTKFIGRLYDDYSLSLCYNAADVFIAPSLQDNLPNTVMESLSCGTPVVAFNIGGMPDMIDHKVTGFLAREKESNDLAEGIHWLLEEEEIKILNEAARKKVLDNYRNEIVAKQYLELYKELMQRKDVGR